MNTHLDYDVVIVGAGPYGLSVAAHVKETGLRVQVFGKTMSFWREQTPHGMTLRSRWFASSLSAPKGEYSMAAYLKTMGVEPYDPLPSRILIDHALWFQKHAVPDVDETFVSMVTKTENYFTITLVDGRVVTASRVVMAPGLAYYAFRPSAYDALPRALVSHTADNIPFTDLAGKDVVIIGGGQSALGNAALMHEAGVRIQVICRSPIVWNGPPRPKTWLEYLRAPQAGIADGWDNWILEHVPYLFNLLPRFLKDYYLTGKGENGPSVSHAVKLRATHIPIHEKQRVEQVAEENGKAVLTLSNGTVLRVDHIILATGYKPDISRLPMLDRKLIEEIAAYQGSPVLDNHFQSSVNGLYFVGYTAHSSFGPLYRFIVGADAAARRVTQSLAPRAAFLRRLRFARATA